MPKSCQEFSTQQLLSLFVSDFHTTTHTHKYTLACFIIIIGHIYACANRRGTRYYGNDALGGVHNKQYARFNCNSTDKQVICHICQTMRCFSVFLVTELLRFYSTPIHLQTIHQMARRSGRQSAGSVNTTLLHDTVRPAL